MVARVIMGLVRSLTGMASCAHSSCRGEARAPGSQHRTAELSSRHLGLRWASIPGVLVSAPSGAVALGAVVSGALSGRDLRDSSLVQRSVLERWLLEVEPFLWPMSEGS